MEQDKFWKGDLVEAYLDGKWQVATVLYRHRSGFPWSRLGEYVVENDMGERGFATEGRLQHALNPKSD